MKYFKPHEQACNCGCNLIVVNRKLESMIDDARQKAGIPFVITSWCRCEAYNIKVGGNKNSSHKLGEAIDIKYNNDMDLHKITKALHDAGFYRVLIYPKMKFIHTDISLTKIYPILKIMEQKDK